MTAFDWIDDNRHDDDETVSDDCALGWCDTCHWIPCLCPCHTANQRPMITVKLAPDGPL